MRRLVGAFVVAALCGTALVAQETRSTTLLTTEHYLNWERVNDAQISPDGSRIVYTRQAVNQARRQVGVGAVDHQRRRLAAPLPRQGLGCPLVAGRQAAAVSRRGRAEGAAALRPLGRRRRPGHADHPRRRAAAQRAVVAGRQVDRLLDVRARSGEVDDQHAGRTEGREVDAGAARGRHDPLPAGSGRVPRGRVHASLRRAGRRRHAASADAPASGASAPASFAAACQIDWTPDSKSIVFDANRAADADMQYQTCRSCSSSTSRPARSATS